MSDKLASDPRGLVPPGLLPVVLAYTGLASFANGVLTLGVFFLTRQAHGYSDTTNLWLALVIYLPYIPAAALAGRAAKACGARTTLVMTVIGMAVCALGLSLINREWAFWVIAPLYSVCNGLQWPIVESYVSAGRHGPAMRRAIGAFNLVWAVTICAALPTVGMFIDRPSLVFGVMGALHLLALTAVAFWPGNPPHHDAQRAWEHTVGAYPLLLRSAAVLLPLGYVLMYALSPLLPGVWERLGLESGRGASWSSIWLVARVLPFVAMFVWPGWHGRWSILLIGGVLMIAGFSAALMAPTAAIVLIGLAGYGIGQGTVYYAALYYRMAVGHARVESGGAHEAMIGIGYAAGPGAALIGQTVVPGNTGIALGVGVVVVLACVVALRPYVQARAAARRSTSASASGRSERLTSDLRS